MAKKKATETKAPVAVLGKLSVRTIYGAIAKKSIPDEGEELELCRIAGTAKAIIGGQSTYGAWQAMQGEFAGTNKQTGEIFIGGTAFVPSAMGDALISSLEAALENDAGASLDFCVDISIKASTSSIGYEYIVRPVMETDITNKAMLLLEM